MGIVEIEAASSAQSKEVERIVAGIGYSEMGMDDNSEKITVGNDSEGSVRVDIDAAEDGMFV